jgi:hypothetical protein
MKLLRMLLAVVSPSLSGQMAAETLNALTKQGCLLP